MKAKDIWLGTMKFNWIKLGVGLGFDLVALILLIVFLQVAPQTELSVDLYGKLCGLSSKFKEMWQNAGLQNENIA